MKKLFKFVLTAAVVAAVSQTAAKADPLAGYDTSTAVGDSSVIPFGPYGSDPGVIASNFSLGNGLGHDAGGGAYNGVGGFYGAYAGGWPNSLSGAEALPYPTYLSFTLTPATSGTVLNLTDIDFSTLKFDAQAHTGASKAFSLESSVTGFGTGTTIANFSGASFNGVYGSDVALGSAFSGIAAPVEFRLYIWDENNPIGTDPNNTQGDSYFDAGITGSFLVNGVVVAPEPGVLPMLSLGVLGLFFLARRKMAASV